MRLPPTSGWTCTKKDIVVALLAPDTEEPAEWKLHNEPRAVRRLAKRLRRDETLGPTETGGQGGPPSLLSSLQEDKGRERGDTAGVGSLEPVTDYDMKDLS